MAFSGDLEHLSIVDLIQLLHSTRKTGTLRVTGRKGTISLAFHDGYINGASHYDTGTRTGTILVENGVVGREELERALALQSEAGAARRPLIATLLENGLVAKDAAYHALETLIELTIVELLTWKRGSFSLEPDLITVCDEFRYFPENLQEELQLPTEHILMDALRIYDEKKRDGLIQDEDASEPPETAAGVGVPVAQAISADDLGLGDLDALERKRPAFHEPLKEQPSTRLGGIMQQLKGVATLPETALLLLQAVASLLPRALTLVVWERELVAERGVGITSAAATGPVLGFRLPLSPGSLFRSVVDTGQPFYGIPQDQTMLAELYGAIPPPTEPAVLLLPLKLGNRVVAIIYGDFGGQPVVEVPVDQLAGCAEYAGLAIESALLRRQQTPHTM